MPTARLLTDRPLVRFDIEGRRVLAEPCVVDLGVHIPELHAWDGARAVISPDGTTILTVPAGFVYDGASLPSLALVSWMMGPKELWETAGLFHDALFRWQSGRAVADRVFWIIARSGSKQVGPVRGFIGWAGLRIGGGFAYRARGREMKEA